MANPSPDTYTISVGVQQIHGSEGKTLYGALKFDVTRTSSAGDKTPLPDPLNIVIRPGDYLQFDIGDITVPNQDPTLTINWKFESGKIWPAAPTSPGKPVQLPPNAGFGSQLFGYCATIDLGVNAHLPAQKIGEDGNTIITMDPDVGTDEC